MRKLATLLLAVFVTASLSVLAAPQQGGDEMGMGSSSDMAKLDRVSGTIIRSSKEKSTLTVRQNRSNIERTVVYSAQTKWTKGSTPEDMKEFKDGSRVICLGKLNEKGELNAVRIDLQ